MSSTAVVPWMPAGFAYDGYLTGCSVFLDADGNGVAGSGEALALASNGAFSLDVLFAEQLAGAARLQPADGAANASVAANSVICHDTATLMPERLPLAAPAPLICSPDLAPLVISAASTLLTVGEGVTSGELEDVFGLALPATRPIGRFNAFGVRHGSQHLIASLHVLRILRDLEDPLMRGFHGVRRLRSTPAQQTTPLGRR